MSYRLLLLVVCTLVPTSTLFANDFALSAPDYSIAYDENPAMTLAGDVDLDGDRDLVALTIHEAHYFDNLFIDTGNREFAAPEQFFHALSLSSVPLVWIRDAKLVDVNGDGMKDLLLATGIRRFLVVMLNDNGVFGAPQTYDTGLPDVSVEFDVSMAVADFDRDGDPDVALSYESPQKLVFFWNNGMPAHPVFNLVQEYDLPESPKDLVAGDFNGDDAPDLVTASQCGGTSLSACLLINTGGVASFVFDSSFDPNLTANKVSAGDINLDGLLDLVLAPAPSSAPYELYPFKGNGVGGFIPAATIPVADYVDDMQLADMELDGRLDYIAAHEHFPAFLDDNISVTLADGPNLHGELHVFQLEAARYVTVADLDNDDLPEIVFGGYSPAPYSVSHGILWNETAIFHVRADIDGSGALNLADAIGIFNHLFTTTPTTLPEWVFDYNDDGFLTMSDGLAVLLYLFTSGPEPAAPYPDPGPDPTP